MKALKVLRSKPVEEVKVASLHLRALVLLCQMLNPILVIVVHSRHQQVTQYKGKTHKLILR
jgi:hypothetical protein